jgi:tetratricopeptide (TPR) repeat protein
MEFLRKLTSIFSLLLITNFVFAQDFSAMQKAFSESYVLEKNKNYDDAIKKIKAVFDNDSYEVNLRLGWLEYSAKNYTESQTHYARALELMPYSEEAKFGLIYPKAALGKWADVINLYNSVLTNSPNNTLANYRLGLIYYNRKDYSKALVYFKKVVDLYPFDYDALIMYAWTSFQIGKTREAKVLFNKVLMLSPSDESALEGLGLIK